MKFCDWKFLFEFNFVTTILPPRFYPVENCRMGGGGATPFSLHHFAWTCPASLLKTVLVFGTFCPSEVLVFSTVLCYFYGCYKYQKEGNNTICITVIVILSLPIFYNKTVVIYPLISEERTAQKGAVTYLTLHS